MAARKPIPPLIAALELRLAPLGEVRARRMFGGFGFFHEDRMIALVAGERLYFKVDGDTKGRFANAGGKPFTYTGKRSPVEMSYWTLPDAEMDDPDRFVAWAELAAGAAARAKAAKRR